MKVAGVRNALILLFFGLVAWVLLVWLPYRQLDSLSLQLGSPENIPPVTRKVFYIDKAINTWRYFILIIFLFLCFGYYFFYNWAAANRESRMVFHNVTIIGLAIIVYGFLLYCVAGLHIAVEGLIWGMSG